MQARSGVADVEVHDHADAAGNGHAAAALRIALDHDREAALAAIRRTKAWRLLDGFRGAPRRDVVALADAMVALGRLGRAMGDRLQSIDINPIAVLNEGQGAVALDALVGVVEHHLMKWQPRAGETEKL